MRSEQGTRASGSFGYLYVVDKCSGGETSVTTLRVSSACRARVDEPALSCGAIAINVMIFPFDS